MKGYEKLRKVCQSIRLLENKGLTGIDLSNKPLEIIMKTAIMCNRISRIKEELIDAEREMRQLSSWIEIEV